MSALDALDAFRARCDGPFRPACDRCAPDPCECPPDDRREPMHRQTQTILHDPDNGAIGNCMQAAIASLLGLPLDDVPHFGEMADDEWWSAWMEWLRQRDLSLFIIDPADAPAIPCLLDGPSPRGLPHMVVGIGGDVVWDPHPSRAGLIEVERCYIVCPWLSWGD